TRPPPRPLSRGSHRSADHTHAFVHHIWDAVSIQDFLCFLVLQPKLRPEDEWSLMLLSQLDYLARHFGKFLARSEDLLHLYLLGQGLRQARQRRIRLLAEYLVCTGVDRYQSVTFCFEVERDRVSFFGGVLRGTYDRYHPVSSHHLSGGNRRALHDQESLSGCERGLNIFAFACTLLRHKREYVLVHEHVVYSYP